MKKIYYTLLLLILGISIYFLDKKISIPSGNTANLSNEIAKALKSYFGENTVISAKANSDSKIIIIMNGGDDYEKKVIRLDIDIGVIDQP